MVVLSYDSAKRSLIMLAVYLVCASLAIKGVGHLLEYNFISGFESLLGEGKLSFELPKFNFDNLSFDLIATTLKEKIQGIINVLAGSALGIVNYALFSSTVAANKTVVTKIALNV
ncbi:hypothetical protein [Peribacillus aracenensis]|uniref:hypothetical protein n=1 Tax=Peribacillus aracenensis TaxID=2976708 RepID=UPI0021A5417F|nr:hypothetical protein [Peribacillus sp. BBB004]